MSPRPIHIQPGVGQFSPVSSWALIVSLSFLISPMGTGASTFPWGIARPIRNFCRVTRQPGAGSCYRGAVGRPGPDR